MNMQTGMMLCRVLAGDGQACRSEDYYDAATLGGADALGRPDLGRLAPGCRADITVFDLDRPHLGQVIDPIQTMMLAGHGRDFSAVIVDGRFAMEDRAIPGRRQSRRPAPRPAQFEKVMGLYPRRTWATRPWRRSSPQPTPSSGGQDELAARDRRPVPLRGEGCRASASTAGAARRALERHRFRHRAGPDFSGVGRRIRRRQVHHRHGRHRSDRGARAHAGRIHARRGSASTASGARTDAPRARASGIGVLPGPSPRSTRCSASGTSSSRPSGRI